MLHVNEEQLCSFPGSHLSPEEQTRRISCTCTQTHSHISDLPGIHVHTKNKIKVSQGWRRKCRMVFGCRKNKHWLDQHHVIFKPWLGFYNKRTLVKLRERLWFQLNVKNMFWGCPSRSAGRACCVLAAGFESPGFIAAVKDAAICAWGARSTRPIWSKRKLSSCLCDRGSNSDTTWRCKGDGVVWFDFKYFVSEYERSRSTFWSLPNAFIKVSL